MAVAASGWAQCTLKIDSVRPCDREGNPTELRLGDPYYGVRVDWTVIGKPKKPYIVAFRMADRTDSLQAGFAMQPGQYFGFAYFAMPLDGPIPVEVTLDPKHVSGDRQAAGHVSQTAFTPDPPAAPVEYFEPKKLDAWQEMTLVAAPKSDYDHLSLLLGTPTSATSQVVLKDGGVPGATTATCAPYAYPYLRDKIEHPEGDRFSVEHRFTVQASNVRTNLASVMSDWSVYDDLPDEAQPYLLPENTIESNNPAIRRYMQTTLPPDWRKSTTPLAAAKALFLRVSKDVSYREPAESDALTVLKTKRGDCAGMSMLYIACLRAIGIPARLVSGWTLGEDQWHCWSEMYVPKVGWVPQDVTRCNDISRAGKYAYDFATVTDLNERVSVARGSKFDVGDVIALNFQHGWWSVTGRWPRLPTADSHCRLEAAPEVTASR